MSQAEFTQILIALVGFFAVYTLNGIKREIHEVKQLIGKLFEGHSDLDKRVAVVESRCHTNDCGG